MPFETTQEWGRLVHLHAPDDGDLLDVGALVTYHSYADGVEIGSASVEESRWDTLSARGKAAAVTLLAELRKGMPQTVNAALTREPAKAVG